MAKKTAEPKTTKTKKSEKTVKAEKPAKPSAKKDKALVDKYRNHKGDTGSTEVQIVLLSEQINELAKHLTKHSKDADSRRGLLIKLGKRRRLLNYMDTVDSKKYQKLISDLKLRK